MAKEKTAELIKDIRVQDSNVIQWLLTQNNVNVRKNSNTILMFAADRGHLNVVKWLVTEGNANVEVSKNGTTALMLAAAKGHLNVVEWLVTE